MAGSGVSEEALALNLQQRERVDPQTGCTVVVPALHPSWCKDVNFLCYVPPQENDDSALWLEALELMDSDLHWLLCQPYQRFWCQVMYDTSLHKMLDSYLHYGPRPNETTPPVSQRGREVLTSFHRRVFMTFLRMSTHKENPEHFLLEETFGDIIYNHFLFDITRLMDLCALYHTCNQPLLAKMINNVFKRQPRYHDDLKSALNSVLKLLEEVTVECVGEGREGGKMGRVGRLEEKTSLPLTAVPAMALYVADIAYSLRSFMETYPPSVSLAVECGLLERLVLFYEETIPPLQEQWLARRCNSDPESVAYHKCRLRQAKADLVWLVHTMLRAAFIPTGDNGPQVEGASVTRFLEIVTTILSETAFYRELERHFSLAACVKEMQALHPNFDQTQFDYVLSALGVMAAPTSGATCKSLTTSVTMGATPTSEDPSVLRVMELLPHLSKPFVLRCLSEYNGDAEKVIHHVLEDTLPSHLRNLVSYDRDASTERGATGDGEEVGEVGGLLDQRAGVYDGDEFDVFRHKDVDLSHIHIGKRSVTTPSTLHDKSHLEATRERYQSYQFEIPSDQEEEEGEYEFDQYQDEYDDTYDSHNVGATDNETAEDLFTVKRLNVKGLFKKQFDSLAEEEDEDEGEGEEETESKTTPLQPGYVTIMRPERRDARDVAQTRPERGRGGGGGWRGGGGRGAGRGGREARDRQIKEKHKSRIANHSRKFLADRKRGRGGLGGLPRF